MNSFANSILFSILSFINGSVNYTIGYKNTDASCQIGYRIGLNLSDYLMISGYICFMFGIIYLICVLILIYTNIYNKYIYYSETFCIIMHIMILLTTLILYIIGIILLYTPENSQCNGNVMGIYMIAIISITIFGNIFSKKISEAFKSEDERLF